MDSRLIRAAMQTSPSIRQSRWTFPRRIQTIWKCSRAANTVPISLTFSWVYRVRLRCVWWNRLACRRHYHLRIVSHNHRRCGAVSTCAQPPADCLYPVRLHRPLLISVWTIFSFYFCWLCCHCCHRPKLRSHSRYLTKTVHRNFRLHTSYDHHCRRLTMMAHLDHKLMHLDRIWGHCLAQVGRPILLHFPNRWHANDLPTDRCALACKIYFAHSPEVSDALAPRISHGMQANMVDQPCHVVRVDFANWSSHSSDLCCHSLRRPYPCCIQPIQSTRFHR